MSSNKHAITKNPTAGISKLEILLIFALLAGATVFVLVRQLSHPAANPQDAVIDLVQANQQLIPGQPTTIDSDIVTIFVPAFAIQSPGSISITMRESDLFSSAGLPEWSRPQVVSLEFLDTKGTPTQGMVFSAPISICFKLSEKQWQDFSERPGSYQIQYYAVESNPPVWDMLPMTTFPDLFLLCGKTDHLSLFALAIKLQTSIPITGPTTTTIPTSSFPTRTPYIPPTKRERDVQPTDTPAPVIQPSSTPAPSDTPPATEPPPTDPPTAPPTEPPPTNPPEPSPTP